MVVVVGAGRSTVAEVVALVASVGSMLVGPGAALPLSSPGAQAASVATVNATVSVLSEMIRAIPLLYRACRSPDSTTRSS
ncbi:MAG TPA: hypothetical protein VD926_06750, partial [Acidimicrobiales bacterium]|nr:hypothetical protein [Acidimicrobiales bacterium]